MAMQMNVAGLRRNLKNIAHNYTDAQVKVREATSNDPWGPSSTVMAEIADLSYNVVAFSEIMQMVWKRLNDHGRNWRHVYKALVLLEYLIKTGSEKIADQCKENIFAIQTLKDFQYLEENKDMGMNVREKAKALVSLLKDEERLRNERVRALKAKERFAQSVSAIGSDSTYVTSSSRNDSHTYAISDHSVPKSDLENARPQTMGEEELQLQLALAMSKEEAEQEEAKKRSDDVRLQIALNQSEADKTTPCSKTSGGDGSALNDLLDINFHPINNGMAAASSLSALPSASLGLTADPWGPPAPTTSMPNSVAIHQKVDPWGLEVAGSRENSNTHQVGGDPWSSPSSAPPSRVTSPPNTSHDPWSPPAPPKIPQAAAQSDDPWAPKPICDPWAPSVAPADVDPFDPISPECSLAKDSFSPITCNSLAANSDLINADSFNLTEVGGSLPAQNGFSKSKSPTAFLGENSNLVNLDNLVSGSRPTGAGIGAVNPFQSGATPPNPFQAQQAPKPSLNEMRSRQLGGGILGAETSPWDSIPRTQNGR